MQINYEQFEAVDLRVGKIVQVEDFPQARKPAYKLKLDFGELGIKQSSAQIVACYSKEDLKDRLVVAVVNFPPKQIANFISEVLVLGTEIEKGKVLLLSADKNSCLGARVF